MDDLGTGILFPWYIIAGYKTLFPKSDRKFNTHLFAFSGQWLGTANLHFLQLKCKIKWTLILIIYVNYIWFAWFINKLSVNYCGVSYQYINLIHMQRFDSIYLEWISGVEWLALGWISSCRTDRPELHNDVYLSINWERSSYMYRAVSFYNIVDWEIKLLTRRKEDNPNFSLLTPWFNLAQ